MCLIWPCFIDSKVSNGRRLRVNVAIRFKEKWSHALLDFTKKSCALLFCIVVGHSKASSDRSALIL